jgi:hypothetical protein
MEFEGGNGCFLIEEVTGCAIGYLLRLDDRRVSRGRYLQPLKLGMLTRSLQVALAIGQSLSIGESNNNVCDCEIIWRHEKIM